MRDLYSSDQKTRLMLFGDLFEDPLATAERMALEAALRDANGDVHAALEILSPEAAMKARSLLEQGLKLSFELDRLKQRGISVLFPEGTPMGRIGGFFSCEPALLFAVGNRGLLGDGDARVALSLASFREAGCCGILIADRALGSLMRDDQIAAGLREARALLVSDVLRTCANVRPSLRGAGAQGSSFQARNVFVSGSRSQTLIPKAVQDSLEAIKSQGIGVLIGDSNRGVDREVIDFLRTPLYENVTLFTISPSPRVKAEAEWRVKAIEADSSLKSKQRQTVKDRVMADEADWGMALFDPIQKNRYGSLQVSSGTLRNVVQMLLQGKSVKFFYLYEREVRSSKLRSCADLESLIEVYRSERLTEQERESVLSARGVPSDADASLVRFQRIMTKYRSLIRCEERILRRGDRGAASVESAQMALQIA